MSAGLARSSRIWAEFGGAHRGSQRRRDTGPFRRAPEVPQGTTIELYMTLA